MRLNPASSGDTRRFVSVRALFAPVLLSAVIPGMAQSLPSASSILKLQESAQPAEVPRQMPVSPTETDRRRLSVPTGGPSVRVLHIRFDGATDLLAEAELTALVAPAIGQVLTSAQLLELADRVTSHLKAQGWLLAQAYLPPQDVTDGEIEIRIKPGRLDGGIEGIVIGGRPQRIGEAQIRGVLAATMPDAKVGQIHGQQLELGLLRLGELAGLRATAALDPGSMPDTSRLTVETQEGPWATGGVTLDNFGGRYTGVNRVSGQLTLNSPMGWGDSIMLAAAHTTGTDMLSAQVAAPVGYSGWKAGGSATVLNYRVGGPLADLDLNGKAQIFGLTASYPLVQSPGKNLRVNLGWNHKAFVDNGVDAKIADKSAQVLTSGLSGDWQDTLGGGGLNNWSFGVNQGRMDLSRLAANLQEDQAGARTHGHFSKWVYAFSRLQPLLLGWSAQFSVNGQVAGRNLDSSEKFSLGGNSGIRAYPGGEASGDSGWVANATLRHEVALPWPEVRLDVHGFLDWGQITLHKNPWASIDNATGVNRYSLSGWGLGANVVRMGSFRAGLVWARTLGNNPGRTVAGMNSDGKADRSRVGVSIGIDF